MSIAGKKNSPVSISGVPFEPAKARSFLSFSDNGNYFRTAQVRWATLIFAVESETMQSIYEIQAN